MKNVLLVNKSEAWGTLTALCAFKGWSYHYLKRQKMPITYKGVLIEKLIVHR